MVPTNVEEACQWDEQDFGEVLLINDERFEVVEKEFSFITSDIIISI